MNSTLKRLGLGLIGFVSAMSAALAAMENSNAMTLGQILEVPLQSWLLAIGAFMTGVIGRHEVVKK